ncbi:MAG TPA: hypothetical protein VFH36_02210 [Acidimicrobiales bacterium]|jgi:hypothetical protein|nr:hypothetical protein [Acidimicrobiales bacterium]
MDPLRTVQQTCERQLGLVLVEQVRAAGLTRSALRHSIASGRFERLTRRVLRAGGAPASDRQSVLAAVLDASPQAFACGATAAALWAVPGYRLTPVHVARPAGLTGRRSGMAVLHELACLRADHVTVLDRVPVIRPELVVLQLCANEHPDRAARALDNLWRRRLTSGRSLRCTLDELAKQGRNGTTRPRWCRPSGPPAVACARRADGAAPAAFSARERSLERPNPRRERVSGGSAAVR